MKSNFYFLYTIPTENICISANERYSKWIFTYLNCKYYKESSINYLLQVSGGEWVDYGIFLTLGHIYITFLTESNIFQNYTLLEKIAVFKNIKWDSWDGLFKDIFFVCSSCFKRYSKVYLNFYELYVEMQRHFVDGWFSWFFFSFIFCLLLLHSAIYLEHPIFKRSYILLSFLYKYRSRSSPQNKIPEPESNPSTLTIIPTQILFKVV